MEGWYKYSDDFLKEFLIWFYSTSKRDKYINHYKHSIRCLDVFVDDGDEEYCQRMYYNFKINNINEFIKINRENLIDKILK